MRVTFIIAYEDSPYAGVVRPFINWAKELKRHGVKSTIILFRSKGLDDYLEAKGVDYQTINDIRDLKTTLRGDLDYVFLDDYIKRLKMLNIIEKYNKHSKFVVYAQVLYGSHAISPVFTPTSTKDRARELLAKAIPFSIFRSRYVKAISKADAVIANSETTATLLYTLYGIIADGVVYPPVDTEIFKPYTEAKERQAVIYIGSHASDTDPEVVKKVCKILNNKGFKVITLGNSRITRMLRGECKLEHVSGVSDYELAKIYSKSMVTLAPQKWEQFGYVVAESIACGTPVIAYNVMGPAEIIKKTKAGILVNNDDELLNTVKSLDEELTKLSNSRIDGGKIPFSSKESTKTLLSVLEVKNA